VTVVAITFAALAVLHIVQNWVWIKSAFRRPQPAVAVLFAGLVLMAGLLVWPTTSEPASWSGHWRLILTDD
jgi:hypothetical protein